MYRFLIVVICVLNINYAYAKSPVSTTIIAKTDQIIDGQKISTPEGPCIIIPENVKNVRIQNNVIGPCGNTVDDVGIRISKAAHHIYIAGNDIHDVSTAIYADHADHPITIYKNTVYGIRGPAPMGQMVRFEGVSNKGFKSRIFGNVSDKNISKNTTGYQDHISLSDSSGSPDNPIVIACNKIRGGDSPTGSGITIGKNGGEWIIVRDNLLVLTASTGIAIAGGERLRVFRNIIWNRGNDSASNTDNVFSIFTSDGNIPKFVEISKNLGIANSWITKGDGSVSQGLSDDHTGKLLSYSSNNWRYNLLKDNVWYNTRENCASKP